ncbi:MAG: hypothetical protein N2487_00950 [Verrucomicrobiae bacterium]|nr:hypothetical protein [Verrucomicrobiae bacterium]
MNQNLNVLGFDLAYLAMLTKAGIKPLSRWEPEISEPQLNELAGLGLKIRKIRKFTRSKKEIRETIFSNSHSYLNRYAELFDNTTIDSSARNVRAEGLLFGYPRCCVESFIKYGYRKNYLQKNEQDILFHWACQDCETTRVLLPKYRAVYNQCVKLFEDKKTGVPLRIPYQSGIKHKSIADKRLKRKKSIVFHKLKTVAPALASILLVSGINAGTDSHLPPINQFEDSDRDYLTDTEEGILSMNPFDYDEDKNSILDGVDLAKHLCELIQNLTLSSSSTNVYGIPHMAFGVETCNICGEQVNMGFLQIVNPLENIEINLPFIAIHYLEHGSFSYSGSIHIGKIRPPVLKTALESNGLTHFIPETEGVDKDGDGFRDWEEKFFNCSADNYDTDMDNINDGIDVARSLLESLKNLPRAADIDSGPRDRPFVIEHPMDGYEICPKCGDTVVMDWWLVYNPTNKLQISIPSMALHYMGHGGFKWEGGQIRGGSGRVSPKQLKAVLDGTEDGHILPVTNDFDEDGIKDYEEGLFMLSPLTADTDEDGMKDGPALAKIYWQLISKLPRIETNGTYVVEHPLRGFVYCPVCLDSINMGYIEIINNERGFYRNISYLELHFLEHGSMAISENGYISPIQLSEIFKPPVVFSTAGNGVKFKWKGDAGKKYAILAAEKIEGPWSIYNIYEGNDMEIEIIEPNTANMHFLKIIVY